MRNAEGYRPYCNEEETRLNIAEPLSSAMERPNATVYGGTKVVGFSETDSTSLMPRNLWPCSE